MSDQLKMNEYLVAFVDLLGFGKKVLAVKTDDDLKKIHDTVQFVHDTFGKNPKDQHDQYERDVSRRKILSLSDSLVIATALNSPLSQIIGSFDNWCDEVHTLGINQAICAANGIFLRGGVSKGQFYFAADVLLSQAQVNAYKIESKTARYPVICLDESAYKFFVTNKGNQNYADDINPTKSLFMQYKPENGKTQYCIDYIRIGAGAGYDEFTATDKKEWRESSTDLRDQVRENIALRNAKKFFIWHKQAIEYEISINKDNADEGVIEKYLWLQKYHNDVAQEWFPGDTDCII